MTPMFAWQLTIFLRHHLHQFNSTENVSNDPMDIFQKLAVKKLVLHLSKVAEMTLTRGEALISSTELELHVNVKQLEKSGLICRVKTSFGDKIQFNHMQMQEFLTAIHYLADQESNYKTFLSLDSLSGSCSFYAGLSGACLQNSNSSQDLQRFVAILGICRTEALVTFPDNVLFLKNYLFLESLFEFQNDLSPPIFGFCDSMEFSNSIILMQTIYNHYLKAGTITPFASDTSIFMKNCKNSPKFYILTEIMRRCDIRKFSNVESYFRKCPLIDNDLRLKLANLPHDFDALQDLFGSVIKTYDLYIELFHRIIALEVNLNTLFTLSKQIPDYVKKLYFKDNDYLKKTILLSLQSCDKQKEVLAKVYTLSLIHI